jgi:hypothetical protein
LTWQIVGVAVGIVAFLTGMTVWAYDLWRRP